MNRSSTKSGSNQDFVWGVFSVRGKGLPKSGCNSHNMFQAEKRGKSPPETWGKGDKLGFLGTATLNGGGQWWFFIPHLPGEGL